LALRRLSLWTLWRSLTLLLWRRLWRTSSSAATAAVASTATMPAALGEGSCDAE
jgi:hypothetical protein